MAERTFTDAAMKNAADFSAFHLAPHMKPVHSALEAKLISSHICFRDTTSMSVDRNLGCVVICFDALNGGTGPKGFDDKMIGNLIEAASGMAVVSSVGCPDPYIWAVDVAVRVGGIVLLVETTPFHEGSWLDCVKHSREPRNWLLWSSTVVGNA